MKRRNFLKTTGLAAAGVIAAPYILPSGRLFAASGNRNANQVVFCLFAGGVRNF
jgi:anaerobic selenocysteine-containing dehydrogenase